MTSDWVTKPLGELITLQRGHDLPSDTRTPGVVPVMGSAGITGFHNKITTKGPGVVIGRSGVGSMGVVSYIDRDYWALNTTLYVTDFKGNNVKFIYYLLRTINFRQFDTGSAQASLNRNLVYPHLVSLPQSLREQEEIGNFLTSLDERISLLHETNTTLDAIAQAMFHSWFVGFEPVHAKIAGRSPQGMEESLEKLFPNALMESELGLIPRGWEVLPIGDVVNAVGGATPDTKNSAFWEPGIHCWTTPKDLSGLTTPILLNTERKLSDLGLSRVASGLLPKGSLLLSSRAPIGYLALTNMPLAINQGYIALLPGGRLPPLYLLFWCRQNMEIIKSRANGSTFMEISKKAFRPISALVPPAEIVKSFTEIVEVFFERMRENQMHVQYLTSLRDALLPRLLSGDLKLFIS